jgi:hypothetical protein
VLFAFTPPHFSNDAFGDVFNLVQDEPDGTGFVEHG